MDKVGAGRLQAVNEAISGWVQEDMEVMSRQELTAQTRQPAWKIVSSVRAKTLETLEVPPGIHRRELDQVFECSSTQVTMTEICDANSRLQEIISQNVSVNKGTALRLCTGLIAPFIETDGRSVWEVVLGDAIADLPMIRPDLEISAVAAVSESSLATRDSRLNTQGFTTDRQNMAPW